MNEQAPTTPRSIVRNHSPYSESTGPIVQEGFVAARVRALQGFLDRTQDGIRSRSPLTPCPLHVYKSRSSPRPPFVSKPVLTGACMPDTCTVKRFHAQIPSKSDRNIVNAPGGPARFSDLAFSFQPQEQQTTLRPSTTLRSYPRGRGAGMPYSTLSKDTVLSSSAQRSQDSVTATSTPQGSPSEPDQGDVKDVPGEKKSPPEGSILSPHAIQADLVEPRATWNCLSLTTDRDKRYIHEQALTARGSIADKLGIMVERGWVANDIFGKVCSDDGLASQATESRSRLLDTKKDSLSDSLDEVLRLKKVPLYSRSLPVLDDEARSESQHSVVQSHVKQKKVRTSVYQGPQQRRKREARRSHAGNTPQRSISDAGVQYLKTEPATWNKKRRTWTLHHLGRSKSDYSQIQPETCPTIGQSYAWDHRSSEQDHGSMRLPPSRDDSIPKSGFDLTMLRDEQLTQDSALLSKINRSRYSSATTRASTRSVSRSTSFIKKFPWYKLALVDKPVAYGLSKGGCGGDRTSRAIQAACRDPSSNQIELSRGVSKSHTPTDCGDEENLDSQKMKTAPHQGPIDQQAIDAVTSYCRATSQPSLQLMASPQEVNERQPPRVPERPHGSHANSLRTGEEQLSSNPHQYAKDVLGRERGPTRTGRFGMQPRVSSQSWSIDTSSDTPVTGDVLQAYQIQEPEVKEPSCLQSHTCSFAKSAMLHPINRPWGGLSGSETARPEQGSTARPSFSHGPRSEMVNLAPKRLGSGAGPLPANVQRSDQYGHTGRESQGGGKGIKKIQVTVTFDGVEDLVIEARLKKRD